LLSVFIILPHNTSGSFSYSAYLNIRYNSNICLLSKEEKEDFLNGDTTFGIKTYDDIVTRFSITPKYYYRIGNSRLSSRFTIRYRAFLINTVKNDVLFSFEQRIHIRKLSLYLIYSYSPEVKVKRYHSCELSEERVWFSYALNKFEASVRHPVTKSFDIKAGCKGYLRYYNKQFLEYDCIEYVPFVRLTYSMDNMTVEVGYGFKLSDARGYDTVAEMGETDSNDPDNSFEEDQYALSLDLTTPLRGVSISADYRYFERFYTSEKHPSVDPLHRFRRNKAHRISAGITYHISRRIGLSLEYTYYRTIANSPLICEMDDKKGYSYQRFGIKGSLVK